MSRTHCRAAAISHRVAQNARGYVRVTDLSTGL